MKVKGSQTTRKMALFTRQNSFLSITNIQCDIKPMYKSNEMSIFFNTAIPINTITERTIRSKYIKKLKMNKPFPERHNTNSRWSRLSEL